jgi:hypothetical protein
MKLQELIKSTELDMTTDQVKAFLLGVLTAQRPLPFPQAIEEMLSATPEAAPILEAELKLLWDHLLQHQSSELKNIFPKSPNLKDFLSLAKDQMDFYLTGLGLSGTNVENCKNQEVADLLDELEDSVMDLDEYLSEEESNLEEGEEHKEMLLETWQDYLKVAKL